MLSSKHNLQLTNHDLYNYTLYSIFRHQSCKDTKTNYIYLQDHKSHKVNHLQQRNCYLLIITGF